MPILAEALNERPAEAAAKAKVIARKEKWEVGGTMKHTPVVCLVIGLRHAPGVGKQGKKS